MMEESDFLVSCGGVLGQGSMLLAFMYSVRDLRVKEPCEVERRTVDVDMRCRKVKEGSDADDSSLYDTTVPFSRVGRYSRRCSRSWLLRQP
jgi:hypothetical protein